jgi:hypothetical protein
MTSSISLRLTYLPIPARGFPIRFSLRLAVTPPPPPPPRHSSSSRHRILISMLFLFQLLLPIANVAPPLPPLHSQGKSFEDIRIPREDLHASRGPAGYGPSFPFGQACTKCLSSTRFLSHFAKVPVLEVDGRLFTQSVELSKWAAAGTVL